MRLALLLLLLCACGGAPEDDLGEVQLDLAQAPSDVACVRATFTGATRSVVELVPPSGRLVSGVPIGRVVLTADAFSVSCGALGPGAVRTWFALPSALQISPGVVANVTLAMFH